MPVKFKYIDGEINFLIFKVYDKDDIGGDTLLCWNAVNINLMRYGYRLLSMKDSKLKTVVSKLIVHVDLNDRNTHK